MFAASIIGGSRIESIAKQVLPFLFVLLWGHDWQSICHY